MSAKDNPYQTPEAVLHHLSMDARHQWKMQQGFFLPRGSNLLSRLYEWTKRHETMNTVRRSSVCLTLIILGRLKLAQEVTIRFPSFACQVAGTFLVDAKPLACVGKKAG